MKYQQISIPSVETTLFEAVSKPHAYLVESWRCSTECFSATTYLYHTIIYSTLVDKLKEENRHTNGVSTGVKIISHVN